LAYRKGTLLIPSGPSDHLFIVCNDTCNLGANLLVNVSSCHDNSDPTCILDVGDHPFIRHPSFVFYAKAVIQYAAGIEKGFADGRLLPQPDLAEAVFERVVAGITVSLDTSPKVARYFTRL
jgi:hypothetical protein